MDRFAAEMLISRLERSFLLQHHSKTENSDLSAKKQVCCELRYRRRGYHILSAVQSWSGNAEVDLIVPGRHADLSYTEPARIRPKAAGAWAADKAPSSAICFPAYRC